MPNDEFLGYPLEEWLPQEPTIGPPLPKWLNIFWPWYKPEVPPVFTCPYCGAEFNTQEELNQHIASAHPPVVYTCPYCGATFATEAELLTHIQTEHPTPFYTCPYCGATFSSQAELDAHIQAQHPTPTVYTCPYCGATFSTETELYYHMQTVSHIEITDGFFRNPEMATSVAWSGWVHMTFGDINIDLNQIGRYLEAGFIWQNNSNVPIACDVIIWHKWWRKIDHQEYITDPPFVLPTIEPAIIPPAPTGLPMENYQLLCDRFTSLGNLLEPGQKGFIYTPVFQVSRRWNYIFITLKINGQDIPGGGNYIGGWGGY